MSTETLRTPYQEAVDRIVAAAYEQRDRVADAEARSADPEIAREALKRQMMSDARVLARRVERAIEEPVIGEVKIRQRQQASPTPRRAGVVRSLANEIEFLTSGEWTEELLDSSFSLRSGRSVKWREATREDVCERRELFEDMVNRGGDGIALCDKALSEMDKAPGACLGDALRITGTRIVS